MTINKYAIFTGLFLGYLLLRKKNDNETVSMTDKDYFRATPPKTANFSMLEFNSKDGIAVPPMYYGNVQKVMEQLEVLRAYLNSSTITVSSGYRSPEHNEAVGGKSKSMHVKGKAVDIKVKGYTPIQVRTALRYLIENGRILDGGIGEYNTFTHYDIGSPRSWKG
jgi:uncharacterized protein YcbK (DUF882 family)